MKKIILAGIFMMFSVNVWADSFGINGFDSTNYLSKKAAGSVNIQKADSQIIIVSKHYDSETGLPLDSTIQQLNVDYLNAQKAELQKRINAIDAVLAEVAALQ